MVCSHFHQFWSIFKLGIEFHCLTYWDFPRLITLWTGNDVTNWLNAHCFLTNVSTCLSSVSCCLEVFYDIQSILSGKERNSVARDLQTQNWRRGLIPCCPLQFIPFKKFEVTDLAENVACFGVRNGVLVILNLGIQFGGNKTPKGIYDLHNMLFDIFVVKIVWSCFSRLSSG